MISILLSPFQRLRLYAGQPDPDDASHFTIGYDVDGELGVIEGWLTDKTAGPGWHNGTGEWVELKVRDGPALLGRPNNPLVRTWPGMLRGQREGLMQEYGYRAFADPPGEPCREQVEAAGPAPVAPG